MNWDKALHGIFISPYFASHPADTNRAFDWLTDLRHRGIGWEAAKEQLESYMHAQGWAADHIQKNLVTAEAMLQPWLID